MSLDVRVSKNYTKVYNFLTEEFASGEIIDRYTAHRRWVQRYPNDKLNREFYYHYERAVSSLCMEGKAHIFAGGNNQVVITIPSQKKDEMVEVEKAQR